MKKYILPLILIFVLFFVSIGDCAWLTGYDQRIKLTIDNTKIDSTLSNFPVTVFFTSAQAEEIFTEFDADSDYMKCAFTASDGETQLYAEKELFDDSAQKAIYHVKVTSVASGAGTDIYYYYDNDHVDNTTYIGAINTAAGAAVWDANFKAVYHMTDDTTSTILDSTSNNNDATKKAANQPNEVDGDVGKTQDFDGNDDYISFVPFDYDKSTFTLMTTFAKDEGETVNRLMTFDNNSISYGSIYLSYITTTDLVQFFNGGNSVTFAYDSYTPSNYNVYCMKLNHTTTNAEAFLNGTSVDTFTAGTNHSSTGNANLLLGTGRNITGRYSDMTATEFRVSNIDRASAWAKGTSNTLLDTLLTYGSEETEEEEEGNALFWFNF